MRILINIITLIGLLNSAVLSQKNLEDDIEIAFQNAKKGIYYALSNIPPKKARLDSNLVSNDILLASVKLTKEVNGVKVESTGYFHSNEVKIVVYKSNDSLIKDGYLSGPPIIPEKEPE